MAGIVIYMVFPAGIPELAFVCALAVFSVWLFIFSRMAGYRYRWAGGIIVNSFFIVLGFGLAANLSEKHKGSPENADNAVKSLMLLDLTEDPSERTNSVRLVTMCRYVKKDSIWQKAGIKMLIYLEKDSSSLALAYGDRILVQTRISEIPLPGNPGEFNHRSYLSGKGIHYQGYARSSGWELIGRGFGNPVKSFGLAVRNYLMRVLQNNDLGTTEYAIASAILLGYDDILDPETKSAFSSSGAMHVLCISGLHVGVIYLVISNILGFLNRRKYLRILKILVLLLVLWLYALITGFSPSVQRAATMFSFILIGQSLGRNISTFNSLAASAFFLLLLNPFLIREVGFQLSYLAVTGILIMYPLISKILSPGNIILRQAWAITCVSFSATVFTFPLSLLYFHQFPNLFLFTNLVAIPASMVTIYSGLLTFLTSSLPTVSWLFATVLSVAIKILHTSVTFIEGLPFSTCSGVWIRPAEALLIFFMTGSILTFAYNLKPLMLKLFLMTAILFNVLLAINKKSIIENNMLVVYNVRNTSAVDFISGRSNVLLADSSLVSDSRKITFHIQNNWWKMGIQKPAVLESDSDINSGFLIKSGNYIQFCDKRVLLIIPDSGAAISIADAPAEIVILSHEPDADIKRLIETTGCKKIILDSSNSAKYCEQIREKCIEYGVEFYSASGGKAVALKI